MSRDSEYRESDALFRQNIQDITRQLRERLARGDIVPVVSDSDDADMLQLMDTVHHLLAVMDQAIHDQQYLDTETGFANADYLEEQLDRRLRGADTPVLSLILLSIPNRTLIAETLDARETRQLRTALRERLQRTLATNELVASLPDGTLAFVVPMDSEPKLRLRAQHIMNALDDPFSLGERQVWLSAVASAARVRPEGPDTTHTLIQAARAALGESRSKGTGSFVLFEDTMRAQRHGRLDMEQTIRSALRRGWLETFLQPLVDLQHGQVTGFEVLSRIRHPERGLISPSVFVPVAERTGLIRPLSDQMMRQAVPLMQDARLQKHFGDDFTLSVNLSPTQLHDPNLADQILQILKTADADPRRLKIELTETAVMADPNVAIHLIHRLRKQGIAIALDDFGSGYSSLAYIRNLPLDQLKIDRSLVSGLDHDNEKRAILEMILTLCERLELDVVAEGIETEAELGCLLGMGAHYGQGFLFSRPQAVDDLLKAVPASGLLQSADAGEEVR
ncbi:GGDEF domain-containing protein [Marinobacter sp. R17]|uniref:putative bifunctional diguanylate cyclase/phosphodiesterase n=1 Tax=Marinobacter sp. R17 TaxID=2484250 RepID=UPI000F4C64AE|nr:GGDEF domain-containing phosphodiesterase [Marinobacter sp. R17]ROU00897.1 GGDEF domain-containing protein [Marinobacter sp. R17]